MTPKLINMQNLTNGQLTQAAQILTESLPIGWPSFNDAMAELTERLIPENIYLAVIDDNDNMLGFGGLLPGYDGHVYELHPIAVDKAYRGRGIGAQIINGLEHEARQKGALTIWLGADDEAVPGETSLSNTNLFENLWDKINNFDPGTHQSGFYLKMGYSIIGVMPDANGPGKPDIYFGKKLT